MELSYYRCATCGFTHQVPDYWSDYNPPQELEMEHFNLITGDKCPEIMLKKVIED